MTDDKLSQATEHDIHVHDNGHIGYKPNYCTDYGKAHGGHARLYQLLLVAKGVAFIGIWPLAWWLGSTDLTTTTKGALAISFLVTILVYDFVMLFRYIKLRYALIGLGILLGLLMFSFALMILLFWSVSQLL